MPCHGSSGPAGVLIHSSIHPCKLWLQVWFRTTGVLKAASSAYSAIQTNRVSDPARPQPVQPVAPSGSPCMHARASLLYLRCRSERCSLLLHFSIWVCFSRPPPPAPTPLPAGSSIFMRARYAACTLHAPAAMCATCRLPPAACAGQEERRLGLQRGRHLWRAGGAQPVARLQDGEQQDQAVGGEGEPSRPAVATVALHAARAAAIHDGGDTLQ